MTPRAERDGKIVAMREHSIQAAVQLHQNGSAVRDVPGWPTAEQTGGDYILVARSTDPGWVFLMVMSRGMVVEKGSLLSHTAIIGRELGIPTIVGVKDATKRIPDGARVVLDGGKGEVQWQ